MITIHRKDLGTGSFYNPISKKCCLVGELFRRGGCPVEEMGCSYSYGTIRHNITDASLREKLFRITNAGYYVPSNLAESVITAFDNGFEQTAVALLNSNGIEVELVNTAV